MRKRVVRDTTDFQSPSCPVQPSWGALGWPGPSGSRGSCFRVLHAAESGAGVGSRIVGASNPECVRSAITRGRTPACRSASAAGASAIRERNREPIRRQRTCYRPRARRGGRARTRGAAFKRKLARRDKQQHACPDRTGTRKVWCRAQAGSASKSAEQPERRA